MACTQRLIFLQDLIPRSQLVLFSCFISWELRFGLGLGTEGRLVIRARPSTPPLFIKADKLYLLSSEIVGL